MYTITQGTYPSSSEGKTLSAKGLGKAVDQIMKNKGAKDFAIDSNVTIGEIFTAYAMSAMEDLMEVQNVDQE